MSKPQFSRLAHETEFYFLRHGNSEANSAGIYQGRHNSALSALGREQASQTGGWFAEHEITRVFCSPLIRAAETAQIVTARVDLPQPETLDELIEIDIGVFSNMAPDEIQQRYPEDWKQFQRRSWEAVPKAESIASLRERVAALWERLIDEANAGEHRRILCVSHGGFMQWIVKATFGTLDHWLPLVKISNCGIFRYRAKPVDAEHAYGIWDIFNHRALNGSAEADLSRLG